MLQLIRHITKNPEDKTRMSLIFANQVSSAESALSLQRENGMFAELGLCIHSSPTDQARAAWVPVAVGGLSGQLEKLSPGSFYCLFLLNFSVAPANAVAYISP